MERRNRHREAAKTSHGEPMGDAAAPAARKTAAAKSNASSRRRTPGLLGRPTVEL